MTLVRFTAHSGIYFPGEVAGFVHNEAARLVSLKVAVFVNPPAAVQETALAPADEAPAVAEETALVPEETPDPVRKKRGK